MKPKIKIVAERKGHPALPGDNEKLSKRITTKKTWGDLDIDRTVKLQLDNINDLIPKLNLTRKISDAKNEEASGCKVLFAGSEKGKKLAAKLLGKQNSLDVYRVNLSTTVSRYIGETEKNLEKLFDTATKKNWILFFDEADALFGKRSGVKDAHDRYANLIQQMKEYAGLIIFSSKNKNDSIGAFPFHLNAVIHFQKPS